jgi:hypothetical protein
MSLNMPDWLEITRGTTGRASDDTVAQHLLCISGEMAQMNAKLSRMSSAAAPTAAQGDAVACNAFSEQRQLQQPPRGGGNPGSRQQTWGNRGFRTQDRTDRPHATMNGRGGGRGEQRPQAAGNQATARQQCSRCGRAAHQNDLYCPMRDRQCFSCGKRGHAYRMCRDGRQPDNRQQY